MTVTAPSIAVEDRGDTRWVTLVNPTARNAYDQDMARQHLGLNGERILLFVGRPDPLKGLEILLSAADLLEDPDGIRVLVIGGEGTTARYPEPRTQNPEPAAGVTFLGRVSHQLLPYYYSAADVCVIPSYYESFGMVALEAMAMGTPVIASDVGGLAFLVKDGVNGFHVPSRDPEALAERIYTLLTDPNCRETLGRQARQYAQQFAWPIIVGRMKEVYKNVLQEFPAAKV